MKIKRAFLLSILIVAIILSGAVFVGFQQYKDTLYAHEEMEVQRSAEHVSSELQKQFTALERTVSVAAANSAIGDHGSTAQQQALARFVNRSGFSGASVIAANGTMTNIVSDVSPETRRELVGSEFGDREYFQRAMNGTTYVSDPVEAESGNHIITVSAPIYRDGRVVGTLNAVFHLSEDEFFSRFASTLDGEECLRLYSRDGTRIFASGSPTSTDFVHNVTVSETGWTVSVREDRSEVESTIQMVTFVQIGSLLAVLSILFGFGWWIYRQSIQQLTRLLGGFQALEDEQYGTTVDLDDTDEWQHVEHGFNQLSNALAQSRAERRERERELRRERDRFEALFEGVPEPIVTVELTDGGAVLCDVNEAFETTFGYDAEAAIGEDINDLIVPPHQEAATEAELLDEKAADGRRLTREVRRRARDGVRDFLFRSAPIEHDGDVTHQFGVYIDITDRNEYEQRLREQRDNLDTLNQVVRHDIRNDLQLVTAYADLLLELREAELDDAETNEEREYIRKIRESSAHAVELTQTARDMAEVMLTDESERRPVSLRAAIESELSNLTSETDAVVATQGPIPEEKVLANGILGSVFRNLLTNAVQHNDKEVPEVTVSATVDDDAEVVQVRVADNGRGVPESQKEAIFGKGEKGLESSGTGLGLYLVQTLVDTYGGDVWVEDNDPEGAVFVVELPIAE
ncbi:ATP-binding protein [Halobellus inordinatus]|uniref:ATP-binding protein n=1 Tax=Halobellus inordinatus TaxID=1126236 RepID=UPI00210D61AE